MCSCAHALYRPSVSFFGVCVCVCVFDSQVKGWHDEIALLWPLSRVTCVPRVLSRVTCRITLPSEADRWQTNTQTRIYTNTHTHMYTHTDTHTKLLVLQSLGWHSFTYSHFLTSLYLYTTFCIIKHGKVCKDTQAESYTHLNTPQTLVFVCI